LVVVVYTKEPVTVTLWSPISTSSSAIAERPRCRVG